MDNLSHDHIDRHHKHRPPPQAVDTHTPKAGLRAIALFEMLKGGLALAAAITIIAIRNRDFEELAEHWIDKLHMNPNWHISQMFVHAAGNVTESRIWAIVGAAAAYMIVRFVEAYGLWHARVWAEWFVILSGALYLPWEIYEVAERPNAFRYVIFAGNLAIVLYMLYVRVRETRPVADEVVDAVAAPATPRDQPLSQQAPTP